MKYSLLKSIGAAALLGASCGTSAGIITFDEAGLSHGDDLTSMTDIATSDPAVTYNVTGVSGSNAGTALIFDTDLTSTADPDLEAPFNSPGSEPDGIFPGNVLIVGNNNGDVDDDPNGGAITFEFSEVVSFLSFRLFDTGDSGATGIEVSIGGSSIGTFGGDLGDNEYATVALSGFGDVASFELSGSGAFDNIQFRRRVPAPATLVLLGLGLAGLGIGLRRRR